MTVAAQMRGYCHLWVVRCMPIGGTAHRPFLFVYLQVTLSQRVVPLNMKEMLVVLSMGWGA